MNTVKITNSEFVRDMDTRAVLNTDTQGLSRYKANRRNMIRQNLESIDTKERLQSIERDMEALRTMLSELVSIRNA